MPENTLGSIAAALEDMGVDMAVQNERIGTQNELIAKQNEQLTNFVPRSQWRATIAAFVLIIALAVYVGWRFRQSDHADVTRQATSDRVNLVAGCGRSNDQRATLRQVIEKAIVIQPAPADLPPDLAELFRQSQERAAKLRADLLALPGVQPVDCQAAFPLTASKENT